jgi:hypothetical protein
LTKWKKEIWDFVAPNREALRRCRKLHLNNVRNSSVAIFARCWRQQSTEMNSTSRYFKRLSAWGRPLDWNNMHKRDANTWLRMVTLPPRTYSQNFHTNSHACDYPRILYIHLGLFECRLGSETERAYIIAHILL